MAVLGPDFRCNATKFFFSACESPVVPKIYLGVNLDMHHPEMAHENKSQRAMLHEQNSTVRQHLASPCCRRWFVLLIPEENKKRGVAEHQRDFSVIKRWDCLSHPSQDAV